ncbi:MAG: hypothetical protein D6788_08980 [Planctomycetota bacterium]|nr:MAG: hypothetical protein D6788_08980 [Planctomycetota bacterium]
MLLLWERLSKASVQTAPKANGSDAVRPLLRTTRLPYDRRCAAITKKGTRCKGRIRNGSDFCYFHDPETAGKRTRSAPSPLAKRRRRLKHLPDGYLRKLNSIAAVGEAMDRLYREVRLGVITPEMGRVLFDILNRLMDAGLVTTGPRPDRTKAARIRPKLRDLLTRQERRAWDRAVENALTRPAASVETTDPRGAPGSARPRSGKHPARSAAPKSPDRSSPADPARSRVRAG